MVRRTIKILVVIFFGALGKISYCQDSASTFKIRKYIYATAAGKTGGVVTRKALIDSARLVIHGCPDCKLLSFQLRGRINQNNLSGNSIYDSIGSPKQDSINLAESEMSSYSRDDQGVLESYDDSITPEMKNFILISNKVYRTYYIEISNIKVLTPLGEERTLNKICLFLK